MSEPHKQMPNFRISVPRDLRYPACSSHLLLSWFLPLVILTVCGKTQRSARRGRAALRAPRKSAHQIRAFSPCVTNQMLKKKCNATPLQPRSSDTGKPGTTVPGDRSEQNESRKERHRSCVAAASALGDSPKTYPIARLPLR